MLIRRNLPVIVAAPRAFKGGRHLETNVLGLTWDPLKDLLGLGKYLMRSPTGEGQNGIGFPLIRKEGWIPLTGLYFWLKWDGVQTPEMQSRQRALPFPTGLTRGRVNLLRSMLHSHSFVLTK
ncbi:unnamed protein product [Prunus armeniaca]|uniref:Uncharacterized protein n=1 Tax=Prunus armeniaca TaxID=36596 RepID=A0A6J5VAX1_PRUAR|nr:unnamed protein product [Prunus armeniaca]